MSEAAVAPTLTPTVTVPTATPATATPVLTPPAPAATPGQPAPAATETKGAPVKYEIKSPDGMVPNEKLLTSFTTAAQKHGLSQEAVQEIATVQMEFIKSEIAAYEAQMATEEAARPAAIQAAIAKDPVLGGKDAIANAATMQRAVEAFGGAEFKSFLDKQQPDAYLQFARFALKVGKAIREDSVAGTSGGAGAAEKRGADILFGGTTPKAS